MNFESDGDIRRQITQATPDHCGDCAVQCENGAELAGMLVLQQMMNYVAENLVGQPGESFDATVDAQFPPEVAEQVKQLARQFVAGDLDRIGTGIAEKKQEMATEGASCSGPLKMRASKKGVMYTVTVCTSGDQYDDDNLGHIPTHVKRG